MARVLLSPKWPQSLFIFSNCTNTIEYSNKIEVVGYSQIKRNILAKTRIFEAGRSNQIVKHVKMILAVISSNQNGG